jgi:hypothetical protein
MHATTARLWGSAEMGRPAMSEDMSRGEMIRRLDESSKQVLEQLNRGPLTADERHVLAAGLVRLLAIVADSLQDQEDRQAVASLLAEAGRMSKAAALR